MFTYKLPVLLVSELWSQQPGSRLRPWNTILESLYCVYVTFIHPAHLIQYLKLIMHIGQFFTTFFSSILSCFSSIPVSSWLMISRCNPGVKGCTPAWDRTSVPRFSALYATDGPQRPPIVVLSNSFYANHQMCL